MIPEFLIVDLFCGAGGTTTGFAMAERDGLSIAKVIACVNHDPVAIESHWKNHPEVKHFSEDIRTLDLTELIAIVRHYRVLYPNAKLILWASLECTNFSKAKGGQPRDADSRTLAEHLDRYIIAIDPDYIQIENVVEFMSWGPLDANGKPVSKKSGSDWLKWRKHLCAFGYRDEWKEMNSADFGAYTSRNRLFGCFAKGGLPIVWPESTHAKKPVNNGMFGLQHKWKPVKDVLDFADEGESIFTRKKALSPKTLERIYAGLVKYVAGGKQAFILKYNSMGSNGGYNPPSVEEPCPVVAVQNRLGVCFIAKYFSGNPDGKVIPVTGPAGAIKCIDGQSLVTPIFLVQRNGGNPEGRVVSVDAPARTLTATGGNQDIVQCFLSHYYSTGGQYSTVEAPAPVIPTKARTAKVWLDRNFSGGGQHSSVEEPAGSVLNVPKLNLVQAEHHYIVNPSHGGHSTSIDAPCPVIVARQDKAPLYKVATEAGDVLCFDGECFLDELDYQMIADQSAQVYGPVLKKSIRLLIVEFMYLYSISNIKMRMLKVKELLLIQGFPKGYHLAGNQSDQKKFIGNSVVPHVVKAWCEAMAGRLAEERRAA